MVKKSESYFWRKRNKQKIGNSLYYDDTRIKRTKMSFFGIAFYAKDEVLEIVERNHYCV